ncbi:MAG: stage III sporulation protein AB [Mycoplasmataceae bacterium]|nr:stage III sporulation protein AB [Mycoplasmataceae bacterium]
MIFIKFLNLSLICFICFYLGNIKAKSYENRVNDLSKFLSGLLMFKTKIEFTYEPINSIFSDVSKVIYDNKDNIFLQTVQRKDELYKSWYDSIDNIKNDFNKEDKDIIKMFGKMLGKTDIKGQISQVELTLKLIEKQIEKAEYDKNKNSKLYKTMGIISGMAICIILV